MTRLQCHSNPDLLPWRCPKELRGALALFFTPVIGASHTTTQTFIEAYTEYTAQSQRGLRFWLNAVGAKADHVERELRSSGLPIYRSNLVSLEELPRLLVSADVHLITLRDPFVGYVLPSKVHACIESGKRILFVGSESSDVHLLASRALPSDRYYRVDVGDVGGLVNAMHAIGRAVMTERKRESRRRAGAGFARRNGKGIACRIRPSPAILIEGLRQRG